MDCHFGKRGRRVAGIGPLGARVVLVGEAPGKDEERDGEPFIGASGRFLWAGRDWEGSTIFPGLESMGLTRDSVRIENVIETRPIDNMLWTQTPDMVRRAQADFWARFATWTGPTVIVPMGNLALNTLRRAPLPLTKKGTWRMRSTPQGKQIDWRDKIGNWRGSIFYVTAENGEKVKCIPTYHPAFILRAGDYYPEWLGDWERIIGDQHFPELRLDPRAEHLIEPTQKDAHAFRMMVHQLYTKDPKHTVLAVDIETRAKSKVIDCIGFSVEPGLSITFDLSRENLWAWGYVKQLLTHPVAKGFHFGLYDRYVLATKGIEVANARWDSHQMHHHLDPRDDHHLAYCASRDLRVRFWKDERKEEGKSTVFRDPRKRWRYNGKDVSRTRALIDIYRERLRERGWLKTHAQHYRTLTAACLELSQTGMLVDDDARLHMEQRETAILDETREAMRQKAGTDLVAEGGGLSPKKVASYFYDQLKCKPFYRRGTNNRTADELAVRRLMRKYKKARPVGQLILDYRAHGKIRQEVRETIVSADGRLRSRYSPTAYTGRLRSSKVTQEEGINAQNRDRKSDLRRMFIADPGQVLGEVDQSQGESRIVDGMSGDPELLKMARILPTKLDQHVLNACKVFDWLTYDELLAAYKAGDKDADEKRQLGKRIRHASNYGMEGPRMAEIAFIESEGTLVLDPDDCSTWLGKMKAATPGIEQYQAWIRQQMIELKTLRSSWGREVYFTGLRIGKEDYKDGYAWLPQHEVGVLTNMLGFVPLWKELKAGRWPGARIIQQGHDSLLWTTPPAFAYEIAAWVVNSMSQERTYPGQAGEWTLSMPCGVKVGRNWKDMQEWKLLPDRDTFETAMERLWRT